MASRLQEVSRKASAKTRRREDTKTRIFRASRRQAKNATHCACSAEMTMHPTQPAQVMSADPAQPAQLVSVVGEMAYAVFPLVKPRFCLTLKFRWSSDRRQCQIKRQRRPGATQWEHPRVPRDGVFTLELPREVAHLRVQLGRLGYQLQIPNVAGTPD